MEKVKEPIFVESIDEIRNKVSWSKFSELQGSAILGVGGFPHFCIGDWCLLIWVLRPALAWFYKEFNADNR
ncbi:MAG: preprotein translocase [Cytophagales bacterium]|nr:preprotein translocase [Cytophagales bacterium]